MYDCKAGFETENTKLTQLSVPFVELTPISMYSPVRTRGRERRHRGRSVREGSTWGGAGLL